MTNIVKTLSSLIHLGKEETKDTQEHKDKEITIEEVIECYEKLSC